MVDPFDRGFVTLIYSRVRHRHTPYHQPLQINMPALVQKAEAWELRTVRTIKPMISF